MEVGEFKKLMKVLITPSGKQKSQDLSELKKILDKKVEDATMRDFYVCYTRKRST
jgi:hypothetical protein